jgi:AAA15 family ATPase/GTPase
LKIFHKFSDQEAQLVAIVQDSCLMDSSLLRPDQIWFIDKDNISDESQLYSLVEYKIKRKTTMVMII